MKLYTTRRHNCLIDGSAVALGTFDGMHKGHLSVINTMLEQGENSNYNKVVFTFSDIPKHVYKSRTSKIMSNDEKLQWLEQMGVDIVVSLPFNDQIKTLSHVQFLDYILTELNAKIIVVGENFKFGKSALGTAQWLKEMAPQRNYECLIMPTVALNGEVISSTRIRQYLIDGEIEAANQRLGRKHFVSGVVKPGKRLGAKLGFATANLTIGNHMTNIKPGVYITETRFAGKLYKSVSNVGYNPTFEQDDFNLETHILDFKRELYGEKISVYFIKRLRDELKFDDMANLIAQIDNDISCARNYFSELSADQ